MKQRIISAVITLIIFIPIFLKGNVIFNAAIFVVAMLGLKEFLDIKEKKKQLPMFIKVLAYLFMAMLLFGIELDQDLQLLVDFRIIAGLFLVMFTPVVLYHRSEKYSINDACYMTSGTLFLGMAMSLLIKYRSMGLDLIVYLFLITMITDTFAYITGLLIGKHKLLEVISPKKTWEGLIGGTLFGVFTCTVFYLTVINPEVPLMTVVFITFFLSLIGQFGDLFFSAIKRYYGVKDFSNIMPGHGGILDRLDSIIFVMLAYSFFITLI